MMVTTVKLLPLKFRVQPITHNCTNDDCPKVNPLQQIILKTLQQNQSTRFIKLSNTCKVTKLELQTVFNLKCTICQKIISFNECYMSNVKQQIYCTGCLDNKILNNKEEIVVLKNLLQDQQNKQKRQIIIWMEKLASSEQKYEKMLKQKDQQIKKLKQQIEKIRNKQNRHQILSTETQGNQSKVEAQILEPPTSEHYTQIPTQRHINYSHQEKSSTISTPPQNIESNSNGIENSCQQQQSFKPPSQRVQNQDNNDTYSPISQSQIHAQQKSIQQRYEYAETIHTRTRNRQQGDINNRKSIKIYEQLQVERCQKDKINKTQLPQRINTFIFDQSQDHLSKTQMTSNRSSFQVKPKCGINQNQRKENINDLSLSQF